MNDTTEILDSPSPRLVNLALLADTEERDPIHSSETLEVDENELLVIVVGERETKYNPETQKESLSASKQRTFQMLNAQHIVAGAVSVTSAAPVTIAATAADPSTRFQQVDAKSTVKAIATVLEADSDPSLSLLKGAMKASGAGNGATELLGKGSRPEGGVAVLHTHVLMPSTLTTKRSALTLRTDSNHSTADNPSTVTGHSAIKPISAPRGTAAPPRPTVKPDTAIVTKLAGNRATEERPPRNSAASPNKRISSNASIKSARSLASGDQPPQGSQDFQWTPISEPDSQEQALFEQRLCEDAYGVAVRKINQNGKSNLRYVKCITLDDVEEVSSTKSFGGMARSLSRRNRSDRSVASNESGKERRALQWGKKKDCRVLVEQFTCVRKGKTTERTRRNVQPTSRLLSLITNDANHPSLDIEAPTRVDRDKFAKAFAKFLRVPLESDADGFYSAVTTELSPKSTAMSKTAAQSTPDMDTASKRALSQKTGATVVGSAASSAVAENMEIQFEEHMPLSGITEVPGQSTATLTLEMKSSADLPPSQGTCNVIPTKAAVSSPRLQHAIISGFNPDEMGIEDGTIVSSLTGAGYDQEIVEELHQALTELRAELESSRAEAARAVKVAEHAIQSAENSNSKDWNSTVTHKAAEAAAQAQRKSAEAMAKARLAEERLTGERRTATFWRRQAEAAEEEAGVLQTRAAAAEVQRASMSEELESERLKAVTLMTQLKQRFTSLERNQREATESAMERNRSLEIELEGTRRDLSSRNEHAKSLQDELAEVTMDGSRSNGISLKKALNFGGKKKRTSDSNTTSSSQALLSNDVQSSTADLEINESNSGFLETLPAEEVQKLSAEFSAVKLQFELLKRTTTDELNSLPEAAKAWASQVAQMLESSEAEVSRLHAKLALESSTRRKLLNEVQDLRGSVRVYCRPRPLQQEDGAIVKSESIISSPSREVILLHREKLTGTHDLPPMAFEFDRIFDPQMDQTEVYGELEELILNVLDGYNICLLAFGQTGSGKTHTLIGDISYRFDKTSDTVQAVEINNYGIHMLGTRQLFDVAGRRNERYQDVFSITLIEVSDERLCDLIAGTDIGISLGRVELDNGSYRSRKDSRGQQDKRGNSDEIGTSTHDSNKPNKLEIRANQDGETIVEGLVSVPISSFEDVCEVWKQALSLRADRLRELDVDQQEYDAASHVMATIKVVSTNIATGVGTMGKIQFVDLAGADLDLAPAPRRPPSGTKSKSATSSDGLLTGIRNSNEFKYTQKSMSTFMEVVNARSQFIRTVPYRNSTVTHLLRDSLEADTKVLMLVTISSDPKHAQETACALRLASRARRINIGKATKHSLSQT